MLLNFYKSESEEPMFTIIGIGLLIILVCIGYQFIKLYGIFKRGNRKQYNVKFVSKEPPNQLDGQSILYLGSSVMAGLEANFMSFSEYIGKRHDVKTLKVCRSGTTLADISKRSYVNRLKQVDAEFKPDLVVVQLSTNDARRKVELGVIANGYAMENYDTKTTTGGIEYIIMYVKQHYNCPVVFYTGANYQSENFEKMVKRLIELKNKHQFEIIDMYNDEQFNNLTTEQRQLYYTDGDIHPTKAGYLELWTPYIEAELIKIIERSKTNRSA